MRKISARFERAEYSESSNFHKFSFHTGMRAAPFHKRLVWERLSRTRNQAATKTILHKWRDRRLRQISGRSTFYLRQIRVVSLRKIPFPTGKMLYIEIKT